jgi:hypothetical protein
MPKVPSFAKAFAGRWRIVEMDTWDKAFLDLVEEAHLTFTGASDGKIVFGDGVDAPRRHRRAKVVVLTAT